MSPWATLVAHLAQLLIGLCLAGVCLRHRVSYSRCFALYLLACLVGNMSATLWPRVFFTFEWWVARQTTYSILRLATGVEVVYWTFASLAGARQAIRNAMLLVLIATFLSLVLLPDEDGYKATASVLQSRITNGTIWLFVAAVGMSLLYRVPVHPWHRAVMTGFGAYLTIFTALLRLLVVTGWNTGIRDALNALDPLAYVGLLVYWTWAAWRKDPVLEVAPGVLEAIQPWRV